MGNQSDADGNTGDQEQSRNIEGVMPGGGGRQVVSNPSEKEMIDSVEPWEEDDNAQGLLHGSWNYVHDSRNSVGPAIAAEGEPAGDNTTAGEK